jgi:hypothetical protein
MIHNSEKIGGYGVTYTLLAVITFSSSRAVEKGSTHNTGILDCFQGYDVKHTVMCLITSSKLETKQRH